MNAEPQLAAPEDRFDVLLRVGLFATVTMVVRSVVPILFTLFPGYDDLTLSALTSFIAGAVANLTAARWFESGKLKDVGLAWTPASARHLALGFVLGAAAIVTIVGGSIAAGWATFEAGPFGGIVPLLILLLVLILAVIGEELIFRGYAFQYLLRFWPPLPAILLVGLLFGAAHLLNNTGIQPLGALNTALWGSLLGYAFWRTKTLWLPIGLHAGWN
ncbi:MAG: type II CAAX endopeptidase family protein, partial [Acidobacteriota bacterium]